MNRSNMTSGFKISVSSRPDGTILAAYIRFREGMTARTKEVSANALLVDYDDAGNLIGVEILAPVNMSRLVGLVDEDHRQSFLRFIQQSLPKELRAA